MTPICSEHSALLKRIAKNLNDRTARGVYADWLQERGEPAWYVVANYEPKQWFNFKNLDVFQRYVTAVGTVPWLEGSVLVESKSPNTRVRQGLLQFAEGKAK